MLTYPKRERDASHELTDLDSTLEWINRWELKWMQELFQDNSSYKPPRISSLVLQEIYAFRALSASGQPKMYANRVAFGGKKTSPYSDIKLKTSSVSWNNSVSINSEELALHYNPDSVNCNRIIPYSNIKKAARRIYTWQNKIIQRTQSMTQSDACQLCRASEFNGDYTCVRLCKVNSPILSLACVVRCICIRQVRSTVKQSALGVIQPQGQWSVFAKPLPVPE